MLYTYRTFSLAAASFMAVAGAQDTQYPANTNNDCGVNSENPGAAFNPYYYSAADADDVSIYANSIGPCDAGSYSPVMLDTPGGTIQCNPLSLDGATHLISCPNYPRGSAPDNSQYTIRYLVDPGRYFFDNFLITHAQATSTAAVATQTVTVTPTDTATNTVITTQTDTFTSSQLTVTTPGVSTTNTITVTPSATKTTTTTITKTPSIVIPKYTQVQATTTQTAPCSAVSLGPCPSRPTQKAHKPRGPNRLMRRDDVPNKGEGLQGDGPLTTTTTPAAVFTTATAPDSTTTVTVTSAAPVDASTTVPNPTPTSTKYTGTAIFSKTVTAPQKTRTKTAYALSITVAVSTKTVTYTHTIKTTPACKPTH